MQPSSSRLNFLSVAIRRSKSALHSLDRRFQSDAVGVRPPGKESIAFWIVVSGNPRRWATLMTATALGFIKMDGGDGHGAAGGHLTGRQWPIVLFRRYSGHVLDLKYG